MKILRLNFIVVALLMLAGCGWKPIVVGVSDVCSQPEGALVVVQGYLSLPDNLERVVYRKGESISVSYQLFLMSKPDNTGDSVRTIFWGSDEVKPNKIKPLPEKYGWNDLIVYTDDGKTVAAEQVVRLTGEVKPDVNGGCDINVAKIESP